MAAGKILQIKRGTAGTLVTLSIGELGYTTDTKLLYIGDGTGNTLIGGVGVLRDVAAGIALVNADLTLKGAPTADNMAATKAYVDAARQGLDVKPSVKYATVASGTLATSFANGQTIDGKTLVTGDRILIKNQSTATENGIYVVNATGAPTRAADFASGAGVAGAFVFVEDGDTLADTCWVCTNNSGSDVVGTAALAFTQFGAPGSATASLGVKKVGNDFQADFLSTGGLSLSGNSLQIKLDGTTLQVSESGLKLKPATAQYKFLMSGATPFDYAETDVSSLAGNGLTCASGVLAVGAGTLISVAADTVGLSPAASDYSFIKAATTPWTPAWASISSLAGAGLAHNAGVLSTVANDMDFGAFV